MTLTLRLAEDIFRSLNKNRISYCHWKSNIRLEKGLSGKTDLDLLVARKHESELIDIINSLGFKRVISENWRRYPDIEDYIGLDNDTGRFLHLHVHYKLITGRSLLKEYHLPFEDILLKGTQEYLGVKIPPPEAEAAIFIIRMAIKGIIFSPRVLLKRLMGKNPYQEDMRELKWLAERSDVRKISDVIKIAGLEPEILKNIIEVTLNPAKISSTTISYIKKGMKRFRRFGIFHGMMLFSWKWVIKNIYLSLACGGKTFPDSGFKMAIVGTDGSGKTTLCSLIKDRLSWKLKVTPIYLGSSRYSLLTFLVIFFSIPLRFLERIKPSIYRFNAPVLLYRYLLELSYAHDRFRRFRKGELAAQNGSLVIYERFPIQNTIDWPIWMEKNRGMPPNFAGVLKKRILKTYSAITIPDCLVYIQIPGHLAINRKPGHPSDLILEKQERLSKYFSDKDSMKKVFPVDGTKPREALAKEVLSIIWQNI